MTTPLLEVRELSIAFSQYQNHFDRSVSKPIDHLNLQAYPGEVLAIVGASGSGKSLLAHGLFDLLPVNAQISGTIIYQGQAISPAEIARLRGQEWCLIPQSVQALDPTMTIGRQLAYSKVKTAGEIAAAIPAALARYHLPATILDCYPHQLSGGQLRRVLVLTAFLAQPRLIVADEPTPGMDELAIAEMLAHIKTLQRQDTAIIIIIHDIMTAMKVADRIAVFNQGQILEVVDKTAFQGSEPELTHPYSQALWQALPENEFSRPAARGWR